MIRHLSLAFAVLFASLTTSTTVHAGGGLFRRRDRAVVETVDTRPENRLAPSAMLSTFPIHTLY